MGDQPSGERQHPEKMALASDEPGSELHLCPRSGIILSPVKWEEHVLFLRMHKGVAVSALPPKTPP